MLYQRSTTRPLEEIDSNLSAAAARHSFGVIAKLDLRQIMKNKGVELDFPCVVYEVCNPHQAQRVLHANGAVSTALPCRISVYGHEGKYTLATILPTEMMKGFGQPEFEPVAREVEDVLKAMIDEAAG